MVLEDYIYNNKEENLVILWHWNCPSVNEILELSMEAIQNRHGEYIYKTNNSQESAKDGFIQIHSIDDKIVHIGFELPIMLQEPFWALYSKNPLSPGDLFHGSKQKEESKKEPNFFCSPVRSRTAECERHDKGKCRHRDQDENGKPFHQAIFSDPEQEGFFVLMEKNKTIGNDD